MPDAISINSITLNKLPVCHISGLKAMAMPGGESDIIGHSQYHIDVMINVSFQYPGNIQQCSLQLPTMFSATAKYYGAKGDVNQTLNLTMIKITIMNQH